MIFDTHAHYDSRQFNEDRDEVLKYLHEPDNSDSCCNDAQNGEKSGHPGKSRVGRIINVGADMKSSQTTLKLSEKYDYIYAAVGVHPDSAGELVWCPEKCLQYIEADSKEEIKKDNPENEYEDAYKGITEEVCRKNTDLLKKLAEQDKVVAIGEIGLDYHWDVWPRDVQKEAFRWQWELAEELNLPIIIHSRDAAEDTLKIVRENWAGKGKPQEMRAIMHCYSYSPEHAEEYLKMGLMFGIGGVVTFKNAKKLKEVVDMLPMDRILLETDCPYMAPDPFRGKRNDSGYLTYVAEKIAEIKGLDVKTVYDRTWENAERFFLFQS